MTNQTTLWSAGGRDLSWDGCVNARDLGGLGQVRPGALVRMEAPARLTAAGWAAVWEYGVRTVIDLRDQGELRSASDRVPRPAGITTVQAPQDPVGTPFYKHWSNIDSFASPLYFPAMLAEYPGRVVAAVRAIATAGPGCVVFHCVGGKDRTGLLALVLLRYQLTAVTELLASHGTTIEASLTATIESLAMPAYLLDNGLTDTELTALHTRLTAPAPTTGIAIPVNVEAGAEMTKAARPPSLRSGA